MGIIKLLYNLCSTVKIKWVSIISKMVSITVIVIELIRCERELVLEYQTDLPHAVRLDWG